MEHINYVAPKEEISPTVPVTPAPQPVPETAEATSEPSPEPVQEEIITTAAEESEPEPKEKTPIIPLIVELSSSEVEETIDEVSAPLAKPEGTWALINLILTVLTIVESLVLLIFLIFYKHEEEEEEKIKNQKLKYIITILFVE